jgi:hypothetical protein
VSVYVFVGPTLRQAEVEAVIPGAVCLPPAAQGDVYRVAQRPCDAIGIIDGYFSGAPSVWHKEILWALSEGIPVFGSASMGALRAAELHTFGMRGVGRIFEAFRDGELEDDDEVAVVHGPAELGYVVLSEPMFNIRATLARAEAAAVIGAETRSALESIAKATFFPQRAWPVLLTDADGIRPEELSALQAWLPGNAVDRKREDALEMLAAMKALSAESRQAQPDFRFEATHLWNNLVGSTADEAPSGPAGSLPTGRVLDELRLLGPAEYERVRSRALLRFLAEAEARRQGLEMSPENMRAAAARLRVELGLLSRDELISWTVRNDLDERSFARLLLRDAQLRSAAEASEPLLRPFLLDELRLSGAYEGLAERARDKTERLRGKHADSAETRGAVRPETLQIRVWFFEHRLGQTLPEDMDAFARALGFAGAAEFDFALRGEWLYSRLGGGNGPGASGGSEDEPRP